MPSFVVDASVAIRWFNPSENLADQDALIRDDDVQGRLTLVVPAFWDYEIVTCEDVHTRLATPTHYSGTGLRALCIIE